MHGPDNLARLREVLAQDFDVDPAAVIPEARLEEDLDLDSIDAADLVVRLKELTGKAVRPGAFRSVRTVGDVLRVLESL
ncbi:MAG: acyl carrier protein [Gammaproteobacteria bacterium]|nr:acyl carrier protein [Gammaproteobacteria bacterium]